MKRFKIVLGTFFSAVIAGCVAPTQPVSTSSQAEFLSRIPNEILAKEYQRRTLELLTRPPPRLTQNDKPDSGSIADMRNPNAEPGRYARNFFKDHLAFAEAGNPSSMAMVAHAYMDGWFGTVPIESCKAIAFAFKANRANPALGVDVITHAYFYGAGLPKDEKRAYLWDSELKRLGYVGFDSLKFIPYMTTRTDDELATLNRERDAWNRQRELDAVEKNLCLNMNKGSQGLPE